MSLDIKQVLNQLDFSLPIDKATCGKAALNPVYLVTQLVQSAVKATMLTVPLKTCHLACNTYGRPYFTLA